ncbi:WD40 repeat protein [Ceratobasidium sp. AG-Ba]|nr:WD40 repeat protein [Ceratobasidium sp. AG-Ba]
MKPYEYGMWIWDVLLSPLKGHKESVNSVVYSSNGHHLTSGSEDESIPIWNGHTGQSAGEPIAAGCSLYAVAVTPDGETIAGGCEDGRIVAYDASTYTKIFECTGHTKPVWSVAFSPMGNLMASASRGRAIRIWETTTGRTVGKPLTGHAS